MNASTPEKVISIDIFLDPCACACARSKYYARKYLQNCIFTDIFYRKIKNVNSNISKFNIAKYYYIFASSVCVSIR